MMKEFLEVKLSGWTGTPRQPFILSGNAMCMPVPSYSLLLGIIGCCLGRLVESNEVSLGFHYSFDNYNQDIETRQRLEFDGKRVKNHSKGTDAYSREFHSNPKLTLWIDRLDWIGHFKYPVGTPALGRSQDLLKIESVRIIKAKPIECAELAGCMLPFVPGMAVGGQLVQLAESFVENSEIGSGRIPQKSGIFVAIPHDRKSNVLHKNLFCFDEDESKNTVSFYFHNWNA
ncbi:hypothetical protein RCC89_16450 [Cytophagaceae bacterium ABcell3]|nr:hypothetical protein RCC89_16450 [Cytophagaceae bacterium ABcell3]